MENDKDMINDENAGLRFLENLSVADLRLLVETPGMLANIMEQAEQSVILAENLDQVLDEIYSELPAEIQQRTEAAAEETARWFKAEQEVRTRQTQARDASLSWVPDWLRVPSDVFGEPVWVSAQEQGEAVLPYAPPPVTAEGTPEGIEVRFDRELAYLSVEVLTPLEEGQVVEIDLGTRKVSLRTGERALLDKLSTLGVTNETTLQQLLESLGRRIRGFTVKEI